MYNIQTKRYYKLFRTLFRSQLNKSYRNTIDLFETKGKDTLLISLTEFIKIFIDNGITRDILHKNELSLIMRLVNTKKYNSSIEQADFDIFCGFIQAAFYIYSKESFQNLTKLPPIVPF